MTNEEIDRWQQQLLAETIDPGPHAYPRSREGAVARYDPDRKQVIEALPDGSEFVVTIAEGRLHRSAMTFGESPRTRTSDFWKSLALTPTMVVFALLWLASDLLFGVVGLWAMLSEATWPRLVAGISAVRVVSEILLVVTVLRSGIHHLTAWRARTK